VQGSITTGEVYYIHVDALAGANVLSNTSGTVSAMLD
jgi:hypothetical protein